MNRTASHGSRDREIAARFAAIETGRVTRPRRTLVYGTHGIGKSSFAARFPSAIVVQTEEGLNGIDVARFPLARSFEEVIDALGSLAEHEHADSHGDERGEEVAERGLEHPIAHHGEHVSRPVDRQQGAREGEPTTGLAVGKRAGDVPPGASGDQQHNEHEGG